MAILAEMGGMDQGEARLRLAHARALDAAGRRGEATAAIATARERILRRAVGIADADVKRSFLEEVSENVETMRRAAEWRAASS